MFQTPQNERSFSSLVDSVVLETGRTGALLSVIGYANATVRECQATGLFSRDTIENSYVTPAAPAQYDPFIWYRPFGLRQLVCARYMTQNYYPKFKPPGKGKIDNTLNSVDATQQFVYASDNYFVFRGMLPNETLATWENYWVQPQIYYSRLGDTASYPGGPYNTRPAYFDTELAQWMYLNAAGTAYVTTTGNPATDAALQKLAMHWIVQDWWEMIREGTKAKTFKQFNDERAKLSYSIYLGLRQQFADVTPHEAGMSMLLNGDDV